MVNYWGNFVKDTEKLFRDGNEVVKKYVGILSSNANDEVNRCKDRFDCSNRLRELETTLNRSETENRNESFQKFLEITSTIQRISTNLQKVQTLCDPLIGEQPHVNPGALTEEIPQLQQDREMFDGQVMRYRELQQTQNIVETPQLRYVQQIEGLIHGRAYDALITELRNVIDRCDSQQVQQYGGLAASILQQFQELKTTLNWELRSDGPSDGDQILPAENTVDNNY